MGHIFYDFLSSATVMFRVRVRLIVHDFYLLSDNVSQLNVFS